MAIYSALKCIADNEQIINDNWSIEFMADLNTLVDLGLIRYVKINEFNFLSRKMMSNIGIEFAVLIAQYLGVKINEFINTDDF
jgi:hypothetical protein